MFLTKSQIQTRKPFTCYRRPTILTGKALDTDLSVWGRSVIFGPVSKGFLLF